MKNIFLTGVPGVGKSTILGKYLSENPGLKPAGYYTERDITDNSTEFRLVDRVTGEKCQMAKWENGAINVNYPVFDDFAVNSISRPREGLAANVGSLSPNCCILDELGRFEEPCEPFKRAVFDALDGGVPVFGVLKLCETPFIDAIKARSDVTVLTVTEQNRNERFAEFRALANAALGLSGSNG